MLAVFVFLLAGCSRESAPGDVTTEPSRVSAPEKYNILRQRLAPFFEPMGKPEPGEWLRTHSEPGQSFEQYINSEPTLPTDARRTIYIRPLGKFRADERKIIGETAEFMTAFFGLPIKVLGERDFAWPLALENYRIHDTEGTRQIRTGYVLYELLEPELPADAAALIAFTSEDLYPDDSMNFVFGQASLEKRVGVWSLSRLRDKNPLRFIERTLKVGIHETGHMFSLQHCTKYYCVMSGSNQIIERDGQPLDACPECTAKICWMTDLDPVERFRRLSAVARLAGLKEEAEQFEKKRRAVLAN